MAPANRRVRRQRTSRRLVATALLASALTFSNPVSGVAHAIDGCTTSPLGAGQQAKLPYVFTGTVTDVAESASAGQVTRIYTVAVDRWWAGDLPERVRVFSPATAADCGLRGVREGTEQLFFGDEGVDGRIEALSFQGTTEFTPRAQRDVIELMGSRGEKPAAGDSAEQPDELAPTVLDTSEPPNVSESITVPAIVVVVGLLLLGLGALLGRRPS